MVSKETLLQYLPNFKNKWILLHEDQTVNDIIREVLNGHEDFANDYDGISSFFDGYTVKEIADKLYNFCKKNIKYKEETEFEQTVASPGAILKRGHCDCKGYSNFIGGVLSALNRQGAGIDWNYRFASYDLLDQSPHHVFIVARDNGNEIWIDPTPGSEKKEPTWYTDKKIKEMPLYKVGAMYKVSGLPVTISGTGTDALTSMFQAFASGGDPTQAIIQFAASPQAGQLIKGITSNLKSLINGIEDMLHRDPIPALVKVYQMFPVNTQSPSYIQFDAQINAIRAYVANQCAIFTNCTNGTDPGACDWMGAYQAVVASYGTTSTWLKVQEAINNYVKDNPISGALGMDINPILVGIGGYLYLTGKERQTKQVTGTKGKNNLLLLAGLGVGAYFLMSKQSSTPITQVSNTFVTDISTLPTETQLLESTASQLAATTTIYDIVTAP